MAHLWNLDPDAAHLNHGSFGAVPIPVIDAQTAAMRAMERNPERFYRDDIHPLLAEARDAAARFLGVESIALVANVTEAAMMVFNAIRLGPGDEIVMSDHAYPHVLSSARRAVAVAGASIREVQLPSPDPVDITARFVGAVNSRTRLVVIDQIASASAWVLPVDDVIAAVADHVPVFVDGAHAPGLVERPLNPRAAFWSGNFHKWAFSARTTAAFAVAPAWHDAVRPLVVSADWDRPFNERFDYLGTTDQSARLSLPTALDFPDRHLAMTWDELRARNHRVLTDGIEMLVQHVGAVPEPDFGLSLRTIELPVAIDVEGAMRLMTSMRAAGVAVATMSVRGRLRIRLSVQRYVDLADFERLVAVLRAAVPASAWR